MTSPKEMEIYEVPTHKKEFRIILLEKFSELQKNTEKTLNEIFKNALAHRN